MSDQQDDAEHERSFRLTGEVDGTQVSFDLTTGEHVVGAADGCDIPLTMAGVSRRHAALSLSGTTLSVTDLDSRNGTFVNGRRIDRRTVGEGDWIGFGPVVMYVVRVHRDDARVAIPLDGERRQGAAVDSTTEVGSLSGRDDTEPLIWLEEFARITGILLGDCEPCLADALDVLRRALGADGACLVESDAGVDRVVVCAAGAVPGEKAAEAIASTECLGVETTDSGRAVQFGTHDGDVATTWASGRVSPSSLWSLVVVGDFAHRRAVGPLLEATLRVLLHVQPEPVRVDNARPRLAPPELVFAPRYVVGRSSAMTEVYGQLRQLLRGDIPVLITGETGVGKEHIAQTLHASSTRSDGPFVAVNCAAIPSELLEAELFGIESGVATGVSARKGKFQLARGGVLFLDEIGDMSLELQAKLLRALQQLEVHPLGAGSPEPIDVRIITATNTDLQARIAANRFRRDLYYRVAGFTVHVPPLRHRREDIPSFVGHFMRLYADEIGKPVRGLSVRALEALVSAPWPGNVRELEHEVRRLVYLCPENQAIESTMVSSSILHPELGQHIANLDLSSDLNLDAAVAEVERKLIAAALARTKNNRSRAAKLLGVSRNGLALKMERLGLS
jgi:DNA-binding NtrC family response regulator